jgi:hypothetical protein
MFCYEMSRRDGTTVAWHEVPGTAPPPKSRPVGYGVISIGVRTASIRCDRAVLFRPYDTILSMATWHLAGWLHYIEQQLEQEEYLAFLEKTRRNISTKNTSLGLGTPDHTVPYGTVPWGWRCPRHCVPGYDRCVPTGRACNHFATASG